MKFSTEEHTVVYCHLTNLTVICEGVW